MRYSSDPTKPVIRGIQKLQRANAKMIRALKPDGARGRAVKYGLIEGQRAAQAETPVDTGALKGSHRMMYYSHVPKGKIYIDPTTRNPVSDTPPSVYGPTIHKYGETGFWSDRYAFYARVERLHGKRISEGMIHVIYSDLPT